MAGSGDYYKYNSNDLGSMKRYLYGDEGGPVVIQNDAQGNAIPPQNLATQVATAIARSMGSSGAALGDTSPPNEPAPAPTSAIRLYDDRTEAPKRSLKQMAAYGLIPLLTGLAGGLMNGQQGAYAGAASGFNALGKQIDEEDKNYAKVKAEKDLQRSHIITAKLIRDLGSGKDGTGTPDKNRYMYLKGLNPKTGKGEFAKVDRNGQSIEWTGVPIYDYKGQGDWEPASEGEFAAAAGGDASGDAPGSQPYVPPTNQTRPPKGAATKLPVATGPAPAAAAEKQPEKFPTTGEEALDSIRNQIDEELGVISNKIPDLEKFSQSDYYKNQPLSRNEVERRMKNAATELQRLRKREDELHDKKLTAADKWYGQSIRPNDLQALKKDFAQFQDDLKQGDIRLRGNIQKDVNEAKPTATQKAGKEATLTDKQVDKVSDFDEAISSMEDALKSVGNHSNWVGALDGRAPAFSGDEAQFRSKIGKINDAYRKVITGAGAGMGEIKRLESRLPNPTDVSLEVFKAKAQDYLDTMRRNRQIYLDNLSKKGKNTEAFGVGSGSATDASTNAPPPQDKVVMVGPDGSQRRVPRSQIDYYKAKGAKVMGE